jgi:hypothetical protein
MFPNKCSFLLLAALAAGCNPAPAGPEDTPADQRILPVLAGRLENRDIDEASGLVRSQRSDNLFWVINDSGKARLHAVDSRGRQLGRVKVDKAKLSDWEDIASFTLDGQAYLLIADIGDNDGKRKDVRIYVVEEPDASDDEVNIAWEFEFNYPDGPQDAEAVAVDVDNARVLVLTKREIPAGLYEVPLRPVQDNKRQQAVRLGGISSLPQPPRRDVLFAPKTKDWWWQPTAMDIADDGSAAVVLTYRGVFYYRRIAGEDWLTALQRQPVALSTGDWGEAESVAFDASATAVYATTEGRGAPLVRIDLPRETP